MEKEYMVIPLNKYKYLSFEKIKAKTPKDALIQYLEKNNIKYKKIIRLTNKYRNDLIKSGLPNQEINKLIDFDIRADEYYYPNGGNYILEK